MEPSVFIINQLELPNVVNISHHHQFSFPSPRAAPSANRAPRRLDSASRPDAAPLRLAVRPRPLRSLGMSLRPLPRPRRLGCAAPRDAAPRPFATPAASRPALPCLRPCCQAVVASLRLKTVCPLRPRWRSATSPAPRARSPSPSSLALGHLSRSPHCAPAPALSLRRRFPLLFFLAAEPSAAGLTRKRTSSGGSELSCHFTEASRSGACEDARARSTPGR